MTDPLRPLGKTPRRAEPIQPDKPGSGDAQLDQATADPSDELDKEKEQSETARSNVRDGFK